MPNAAVCAGCGYSLRGLPKPVCPECGRAFDPDDPRTLRIGPKAENKSIVVVAMYLLTLVLSLAGWASMDSTKWAGHAFYPIHDGLFIGLWQACGPVAFWMIHSTPMVIILAFAVLWTTWLTIVCTTRLKRLPYPVHFVLGVLWCADGCPATGLVIT